MVPAVRDVSFSLALGETLAIVGESGSGKSVTALSIMRLIEREGGVVTGGALRFVSGQEVINLRSAPERVLRSARGRLISMVFQEPMTSLNPVLPIGEQIGEVLRLHAGASAATARAETRRMLDRVRIPDAPRRLGQFPHELFGGMRQRVMIAMAMLCRPALLIANEPTTALDLTVQAQFLALMQELQHEIGMGLLLITHDLGVVAEMADKVVVMAAGRLIETGDAGPLFAAPRETYTRTLMAAAPRLGAGARAARDRPGRAGPAG